jgi:sugar phosphate isomerase/epimerase
MALFKIGCQTYSWEMLREEWQGTPDQILESVARAGYAGVEFSNQMIGEYLAQPERFARALAQHGLACAGFAYARTGFTDPAQETADLAGAEAALQFAAHFGVPLCLGGPSSPDRREWVRPERSEWEAKLAQALRFYAQVAGRALKSGVSLAVHAHSHHTSLVLTASEYDRLL